MTSDVTMVSPMDFLPNEMILQIFSHSDCMLERIHFSELSRRFLSLAKVKTWRKSIYITIDDVKLYRLHMLRKNKLLQEAKMCKNLETLIIDLEEGFDPMTEKIFKRKFEKSLPYILCYIFKECLKLNKVECQIYNRSKKVFSSQDGNLFIDRQIERSKYFDQMVDSFPGRFRTIEHYGPQTLLPTSIIDRSSDVLGGIRCTDLTLNPKLLSILTKCKKLKSIEIEQSFIVEPGMELMDFPKLNLRHLVLLPAKYELRNLFHNHPKLLDLFISDSLENLSIGDHVLAGHETLVLTKCKNLELLKLLNVRVETGQSFSGEEAIKFYKNILSLFKQSTKLTEMWVLSTKDRFTDKFAELLPIIQEYEFEEISKYNFWYLRIRKIL